MTMGLTIREAYPVSLKGILDQEPIKKKRKTEATPIHELTGTH